MPLARVSGITATVDVQHDVVSSYIVVLLGAPAGPESESHRVSGSQLVQLLDLGLEADDGVRWSVDFSVE